MDAMAMRRSRCRGGSSVEIMTGETPTSAWPGVNPPPIHPSRIEKRHWRAEAPRLVGGGHDLRDGAVFGDAVGHHVDLGLLGLARGIGETAFERGVVDAPAVPD